jgi:hypothetical protein
MATCLAVAAPAHAWVESHQSGDDVRVRVDTAGIAHFEHTIPYRVKRGPLRSFDISGVELNVVPDPAVIITAEDGKELGGHLGVMSDHVLRVTVDEPRQMLKGTFTFHVKYAVDLVESKELTRDGALWRLSWSSPIATEGFDGAKTVFELPASPSEPRVVNAETGNVDDSVIANLERTIDRDQLDVVRPHVARGEAVAWTLRLDPKAFRDVTAPELRPAPPPPPPPPDRIRESAFGAALFALALLFALLVRHKERAFAAACAAEGGEGTLRALVPIATLLRAILAGGSLAAGVALEVDAQPTAGALLIAVAMLLATLRPPQTRAAVRGPGKWLALRPEDAFAKQPRASHWLDIGSRSGKIVFAFAAALLAGAAWGSRWVDAEGPYLVALDALVLVPIFFTGRMTQLAPHAVHDAAPRLRGIFRRLHKDKGLRTVPWARVPLGQSCPDELRLLTLPRVAIPGLLGIEIGVAWADAPTGWAPSVELLVRVQEGSAAAARMAVLAPSVRRLPGRRQDERVVRLEPRVATRAGTLALARRLGIELVDRRMKLAERAPREPKTVGNAWQGAERRVPRNVVTAAASAAQAAKAAGPGATARGASAAA